MPLWQPTAAAGAAAMRPPPQQQQQAQAPLQRPPHAQPWLHHPQPQSPPLPPPARQAGQPSAPPHPLSGVTNAAGASAPLTDQQRERADQSRRDALERLRRTAAEQPAESCAAAATDSIAPRAQPTSTGAAFATFAPCTARFSAPLPAEPPNACEAGGGGAAQLRAARAVPSGSANRLLRSQAGVSPPERNERARPTPPPLSPEHRSQQPVPADSPWRAALGACLGRRISCMASCC
ncbi:hypothetical protein KFE25_002124 [Diacronema lutheri]|uniref:Uncharacterized protein n=1 Tax=Diacronema lutheri TaxID=2081491 RepID=A0A8J5XFZ3_DIALT|nr:hypothetical protein KFE25_002124 [Diacronema lutheri]